MSSSNPVYRSSAAPPGCGKIRLPSTAAEGRECGIAVGGQEVLPRPRRQIADLSREVFGSHEPARGNRRSAGPVAFVVRHHREVDLDDGGARLLEVAARGLPEVHDRRPGVDAGAGRPADAGGRRRAGHLVGVDVHAGDADAPSVQRASGIVGARRLEGGVGVGAECRRGRDLDPRLHAPEVAPRFGIVRDDDVEHRQQVGHRARVGHDDVHRRHEWPVAAHRDDAPRGRVGAEGVVGCRAPAARPRLLAQPERREARRSGRARAVGRARGEGRRQIVRVVGALRPAVEAALHAAVGHRRHVGEAEADRAPGAEALDRERVPLRDEVGERGAAGGGREPPHEVAVLGGVRDAVERTEHAPLRATGIGCRGLGHRVGVVHHHGVQGRRSAGGVVGRDATPIGVHQVDARGLARLQSPAQVGDARLDHVDVIGTVHVDHRLTPSTRGCCWVMQCTPPPRAKIGRASTPTTRRPG